MSFFRAYSSDDSRPLRGHALLFSIFNAGVAAVAVGQWRSGKPLPERIPAEDMALMAIATYKLSRVVSKDKITGFLRRPFTRYKGESERPSEVSEEPRGTGFRRAVGELLVCPYCLDQWVGTAFVATYLREPRLARTLATLFTVVSGADLLQETWVALDKRA
ncbi:MAG: DUF1360 domain-containing protein [Solirubrobacteraceae bacterium]